MDEGKDEGEMKGEGGGVGQGDRDSECAGAGAYEGVLVRMCL